MLDPAPHPTTAVKLTTDECRLLHDLVMLIEMLFYKNGLNQEAFTNIWYFAKDQDLDSIRKRLNVAIDRAEAIEAALQSATTNTDQ